MLARDTERETSAETAGPVAIGPFAVQRLLHADVAWLVRSSVQQRKPLDIAICNAHTILTALDDPDYAETLRKMTLLNDGIGIGLANRFLHGQSFPENLNGTDLIPNILSEIGTPLRIYLLGSRQEQANGAREHLEAVYPMHEVVGCRDGYFDEDEIDGICAGINAARPDLLLVAMGNPRQEFFITRNRAQLNVPVAIGVGALFDFMSGAVVRAPVVVQKSGLEWLFRLLQEPRRLFRRYVIGIPRFMFALVKLKYGRSEKET
ncbi:WecB/TagA/CpsF family glycosyltransferase [Roseibium sp. Sym1]|uniref:WecB/TagA/CpsF family glycosyltransferase n=1 Tax=Roseibium sp. Sym1 TaxID=3016006 RepID=UPI0022B4DB18|nr:WecB/TagA/CpsF family glycosyltransferase [Roseibium sp. Sym1]